MIIIDAALCVLITNVFWVCALEWHRRPVVDYSNWILFRPGTVVLAARCPRCVLCAADAMPLHRPLAPQSPLIWLPVQALLSFAPRILTGAVCTSAQWLLSVLVPLCACATLALATRTRLSEGSEAALSRQRPP